MGIDIYVEWRGQTAEEQEALASGFVPAHSGHVREPYRGKPCASYLLVPEAFNGHLHKARIPARRLRDRLSKTVKRIRADERSTTSASREIGERFAAFVEFCERKEAETGAAVWICVRPVF